jgi:hypothetical protein
LGWEWMLEDAGLVYDVINKAMMTKGEIPEAGA